MKPARIRQETNGAPAVVSCQLVVNLATQLIGCCAVCVSASVCVCKRISDCWRMRVITGQVNRFEMELVFGRDRAERQETVMLQMLF